MRCDSIYRTFAAGAPPWLLQGSGWAGGNYCTGFLGRYCANALNFTNAETRVCYILKSLGLGRDVIVQP